MLRRLAGDGDVALLARCPVGRVRAGVRRIQPGRPVYAPVHRVVQHEWFDEVDSRFHLRKVDVLALPRSLAVVERRSQRRHSVARRDEIRVGAPRAVRRAVWPAGYAVNPRERRALPAVAAVRTLRPGLPAQAGAQHHQVWPLPRQLFVAETEPPENASREALRHHIRPVDQLFREFHSRRRLQVQVQPELGTVEVGHELARSSPGIPSLTAESCAAGPAARRIRVDYLAPWSASALRDNWPDPIHAKSRLSGFRRRVCARGRWPRGLWLWGEAGEYVLVFSQRGRTLWRRHRRG